MVAWGPILQGGASLLGAASGLFGGKKDDYHPEVWRNDAYKNKLQDVRAIRDAANMYGFHPLALLGASGGGSGGFAQPVTSYSSGGGYAGDIMSGVGDALAAGASLYESDQDRRERAQDRLDRLDEAAKGRLERRLQAIDAKRAEDAQASIRRAEVDRINSETFLNHARTRTELMQAQNMMKGAVSSGVPSLVSPDGSPFNVGPGSSAQDWEDRYGDIVGWFYGMGNYFRDLHANTSLPALPSVSIVGGGPKKFMGRFTH